MPAINALLPIVAASNSQKQDAQSRANESRADVVKTAESFVAKGLDQDAAAEKRMQQKHFINAYEEGMQEQGRQQERKAQKMAAQELVQREDAAAIAMSGSDVPPVGESLPTPRIFSASELNAQIDGEDATMPVQSEVPSAASVPIAANSDAGDKLLAAPNAADTIGFERQQQSSAEAFHALVSAQNGEAEAMGATLATEPLGISSLIASQVHSEGAALTDELGRNIEPAEALNKALRGASSAPSVGEEALAELSQESQSAATRAAALAGNGVMQGGDRPDQAQLVRAWRGVDAQELRSATTATSHAVRQEPVAASVPISLSGQIQQFAHSLRLVSAQPDVAASAATSDRSAASTTPSSTELSPWRADSTSASLASTASRATAANTSFAQTMQASNFGQPLGEKVGHNAWGESIAQRVSLMAGLKVNSAQIQLDPPELGAMTVKVSVNGDQASVTFHSPHAVVRDALELSFPRLQEMMGQQGMQLVDAQVSDNSTAGRGSGESASGGAGQSRGELQEEVLHTGTPHIVRIAAGLIDFYA